MIVCSLDPGSTTGMFVVDAECSHQYDILLQDQITTDHKNFLVREYDIVHEVKELCGVLRVEKWVIEDFVLRPSAHGGGKREGISAARITAGLIALLESDQVFADVTLQQPAAKAAMSDDRLKKLNMFYSGRPHLNDAVRHMIVYLRKIKCSC